MGLEKRGSAVAAYADTLDQVIPAEHNQDLVIGTWKVRAFNRLTPQLRSAAGESSLGDLSNVFFIGRDAWSVRVVAVQEAGSDPEASLAALQGLGSGWAFLLTDVVLGDLGHAERLVFVFVATPSLRAPMPARRGSGGGWRLNRRAGASVAMTP